MNVKELIDRNASRFPSKTAIFFKDKEIGFGSLKGTVDALANYLLSLDADKTAKIGVYLPTVPEYVYSYAAVYAAGKAIVPLDFMLTEDELIGVIRHSHTEYLIAFPKKRMDYSSLLRKTPLKKIVVIDYENTLQTSDTIKSFYPEIKPFYKKPFSQPLYAEGDLSTIFYTSGTTGIPKGVMLTYRHLSAPAEAFKYFLKLNADDVTLCSIPLSHIGGLDLLLILFMFGIPVVLMERFHPLEFLRTIEKYTVSLFCIVPSMYTAIVSLKEFDTLPADLSSLHYAVVFGAPSSPDLLKRFHARCPKAHLLHGWGLTETSAPNTVTPPGSDNIASVGKPVPWMELKIVDENGTTMPPGEKGHLLIKGWPVFKGYYDNETLTKESFTDDGFFKTGDVAYFDKDGFLYIAGRIKEIIKVGGQLVFAPEVEAHIALHDAVYESAVIGVNDALRGELPKAFVVVKEGKRVTEQELKDFLKRQLAHFKIPHAIEFRQSLPKNRMGKVNKEALRETNSRPLR